MRLWGESAGKYHLRRLRPLCLQRQSRWDSSDIKEEGATAGHVLSAKPLLNWISGFELNYPNDCVRLSCSHADIPGEYIDPLQLLYFTPALQGQSRGKHFMQHASEHHIEIRGCQVINKLLLEQTS